MDWINIAISALIGGTAAALAYLFVRNPREKRWQFALAMILCIIPVKYFVTTYIEPPIHEWYFERQLENAVNDLPMVKQIKKIDPKTFQLFKDEVRSVVKQGQTVDEAIQRLSPMLMQIATKYLPLASDDALFRCSQALTQTMEELTEKDPMLTYKWLFPQKYGHVRPDKIVKPETTKALMTAMDEVLLTGSSNPVIVKDFSLGKERINQIMNKLTEKYGADVAVLSDMHAPGVDKAKACQIMISLYHEILKLPKEEGCTVFRCMYSQGG